MFKVPKVFLPVAAVSFLVACSESDPVLVGLDEDLASLALADLSGHSVTYERQSDKASHTDRYCNDKQGAQVIVDADGFPIGVWTVVGEVLTASTILDADYEYTVTGATLEKGVAPYAGSFTVSGGTASTTDSFTVTNISEMICVVAL